jgi:hemerythrin-like domain-containing protein
MHPFLRKLCEEHVLLSEELRVVEEAILSVQKTGFTGQVESTLRGFCQALGRDFIPHSRQEEALLFPLLHERLIADGEHSKGRVPTTAVDLMKDDHVKIIQLAAVILNFLRLAPHLTHQDSRLILQDAALRQAKSLVELLRLHVFREDNIVFSLAHRLISAEEFARMRL